MDILPLILDGILIVIFVSFILDGRKKGFIKTVLSLIATLISIVIAKEYSPSIAQWVNDTFVHEIGVKWLTNLISDNLSSGAQAVSEMIPKAVSEAVAAFADTSVESLLSGVATNADVAAVAEKIYAAAENAFIIVVITAIVFLVIYAVLNAVLSIGISFINKIFRLPVLKGINKFLGGIIGAVKGALGIFIICAMLLAAAQLFAESPLQVAVNGSEITQFMRNIVLTF